VGLILLICVVTFLTIPILFTVQTARKVGKPTIGPRATQSPEWREAMRELDDLESDPSLRYFPMENLDQFLPLVIGYQPVPDSEKVHAAVNHRRPDHDVNVVRNACGDVVYAFRTGDARSFPGDTSPAALITVPKSVTSEQIREMEVAFRNLHAVPSQILQARDDSYLTPYGSRRILTS